MQFETSPDKQLLAKVDGREILPSMYAIEHAKIILEKRTTDLGESAILDSSLAQLISSQALLDSYVAKLPQATAKEDTSVVLDAGHLHLGLQGIIDGIRPGRERRLVKRMIRILNKRLEK